LMGLAYAKLGISAKSRELFEQAIPAPGRAQRGEPPAMLYYEGLAALRLGRNTEATRLFDGLIAIGNKALAAGSGVDYFAKFGGKQSARMRLAEAHYLTGLGNLGKGETGKARDEFQAALKLNVSHLGATAQLAAAVAGTVASR